MDQGNARGGHRGMIFYTLNGMRVTKEEFDEVMAMLPDDRDKYLGVKRCPTCNQTIPPGMNGDYK